MSFKFLTCIHVRPANGIRFQAYIIHRFSSTFGNSDSVVHKASSYLISLRVLLGTVRQIVFFTSCVKIISVSMNVEKCVRNNPMTWNMYNAPVVPSSSRSAVDFILLSS